MKVEDKVNVKYSTGWRTGIIKKVTPKTYTIEFKGGEVKRVNKQMEIELAEELNPTATTAKPAPKKKVTKKPIDKIVDAVEKVEKFTEAVNSLPTEEKGFLKGKNKFSWKLWLVIIGAIGIAIAAILKSQGVF